MATEILRHITGIHVFPIVSLVLFVAVFVGVLVQVTCMDAARVAGLAALPLDQGAEGHVAPRQGQGENRTER